MDAACLKKASYLEKVHRDQNVYFKVNKFIQTTAVLLTVL